VLAEELVDVVTVRGFIVSIPIAARAVRYVGPSEGSGRSGTRGCAGAAAGWRASNS
jgi:hypothetical protein